MRLSQKHRLQQVKRCPPQSVTRVEKGFWGQQRVSLPRADRKIVKLGKAEAEMSYNLLSRNTWQGLNTREVKKKTLR